MDEQLFDRYIRELLDIAADLEYEKHTEKALNRIYSCIETLESVILDMPNEKSAEDCTIVMLCLQFYQLKEQHFGRRT